MSQIKLAFVANDGVAYAPETEIGKHLGFITWTPSKLRIFFPESLKEGDVIKLSQNSKLKPYNSYWTEEEVINFLPQFILRELKPRNSNDLMDKLFDVLGSNAKIRKFFNIANKKSPLILLRDIIKVIYKLKIQDRLLNHFIVASKVKFYETLDNKEEKSSITVSFKDKENGFIDIYVAGNYQNGKLNGGASLENKDIQISASCNEEISSIETMIRVRRNANELTKKAKKDYLEALSEINKRDEEGIGIGIYSTDFVQMHINGSQSIAHRSDVFLPWHRLYILDVERQLQLAIPQVSLHYWKFDEAAPNIFKKDFIGETIVDRNENPIMLDGIALNFAMFDENNPLYNWSIGREKLIRRLSWFNNQEEGAGFFSKDVNDKVVFISVDKENEILSKNKGKTLTEFTKIEGNPHGYAHVSNNGYINNVPTAPKDPLFFFLHSNVDRLWTKWQIDNNYFNVDDKIVYKTYNEDLGWKNKNSLLWPWKGSSTPNKFHMLPPGSRSNNFSTSNIVKNFDNNTPKIGDAIDAFGKINFSKDQGFAYDDCSIYDKINHVLSERYSNTIEHKPFNVIQELINLKSITENSKNGFNLTIHDVNNRLLAQFFKPEESSLKVSNTSINANIIDSFKKVVKNSSLHSAKKLEPILNDLSAIEAIYNFDFDKVKLIEDDYKILLESLNSKLPNEVSKYLVIYLLAVINYEKLDDDKIFNIVENNIAYLSDISKEEVLDVKIALYSFVSNSTIREKIIPLFFPTGEGLKEYLTDLKNRSEGNDSLSNKYWALHTLLTNAGVGK